MTKEDLKTLKKERNAQSKKAKLINYVRHLSGNYSHIWNKYEKFVCIDVENYEHRQEWIMEIGMSIFTKISEPQTRHFIIKQHLNRFNKKWVPDNKMNFDYGNSEVIRLPHAASIISGEMRGACMVGHGMSLDTKAMHSIGVSVNATLDTQKMHRILSGERTQLSLIKLLELFGITDPIHLHNGGNDAHYTATICKLIMSSLYP